MSVFINYITKSPYLVGTLLVMLIVCGCNSNKNDTNVPKEDVKSKKLLQGSWANEIDDNVVFTISGDTIYYNDSLSSPATFYVVADTMIINQHKVVKYPVKKLTSNVLVFLNQSGDEVSLVKSEMPSLSLGERKGNVSVNQHKVLKSDTVMVYKEKHYHAYTQVNPTTYKVFKQTTNNDGLSTESVYYDNIVHIALYDGQKKVFGQNITKWDMKALVPNAYLEQAVLSEITVDGANEKGVRFVAILAIPDSYTNYRVNIDISSDGKKGFSL